MFSIMIVKNPSSSGENDNFLHQYLLCKALWKLEKFLPTLSHMTNREKIKALTNEELHFVHFLKEASEQYKAQTHSII